MFSLVLFAPLPFFQNKHQKDTYNCAKFQLQESKILLLTFLAIWGQKLDPRQDFFYFFRKKNKKILKKNRDFYEKVGQI